MQTCETCGAQFESSGDVQEVTSLRVLCAKCAAERAAAKARKAQSASGAAPRPAPSASARPAQPTNSRPAPSASARSASPAATRPAAPEMPAQRVVERPSKPPAAPAPAASSAVPAPRNPVAASTAAKPTGSPAPAPRKLAKKKKPEIELASRDLKKKGSREMIIAYVAVVVVCGAAGFILWKVMGKHTAEKQAEDAVLAKIENFRKSFMEMTFDTEDSAKAMITFAEENKPTWQKEDFAQDVMSRTAKAKNFLEQEEKRRTLTQRLAEINAVLARAEELPPSELAEQRRRLDDLSGQSAIMGADFLNEVAKARENAEHTYIARLESAAQAAAATEPLDRAALTTIQQSEDELFKLFNTTALAWNKNRQDPALTARKEELEGKYKAMITLSDDAVGRFFTPAVIETVPWRDLLSDSEKGTWKGAATLKGFKIEGGEMHLVGLDPTEEGASMISIGDNEVWRDFVIDIEFTLVKGSVELFFRMPLQYQEGIQSADLSTDEGQLEAGRSYTYAYSCVGSSFVEEQKGEDSPGLTDTSISWVKVRKGAFAIAVPKETEIRITRLRAKVLRPAQ